MLYSYTVPRLNDIKQTNTNTDIKPSPKKSGYDSHNLREKQKVTSGIKFFSIRKTGVNMIKKSGAQTTFRALSSSNFKGKPKIWKSK